MLRETVTQWASVNYCYRDWPSYFTQVVENTLDPLHFAEVHRMTRIPVAREEDIKIIKGEKSIEQDTNLTERDFPCALIYSNLWYLPAGS